RSLRGAASAPRRDPTDRRRARGRAHIRGRGVLGDDGVARQGARRGAAMRGALVTGASRGIGRAGAHALRSRGEKVAVHYGRRREEAERTLAALHGDGHVLVGGDLSDPETAERVVEEAVAGLGQVDVLVNNAGIAPGPGTDHRVDEVDFATWQR